MGDDVSRPVRIGLVAGTLLLGGCATFSEDGGFAVVQSITKEKIGREARWLKDDESRSAAREEVDRILERELTAEDAMQIALLGNPGLQADYTNLGISEADLVQASRLPNPGFRFERTSGGGTLEIERSLEFNLLALLTVPFRTELETRRFEAAKLAAAAATVDVAMTARRDYFDAVAARQSVRYREQVVDSAEASRELMKRMRRVGNASRLELAREQLFHAEATTGLARALQQESAAREALTRSLGLWGEQLRFRLPDRLPELPEAPREIADIEQAAIDGRLDIRSARHALDSLSRSLGLTRATRFVNVLELGLAQVREKGEPVRDGYEITLEIPIFDWGGARVAKAEAIYMQAAEALRETAVNARSHVRQAYRGYRSAYDIAKHYRDEIVPLRRQISDEQLLRYNGMLIGVFELIADAREQVASVSAYLDALRDFWLAETMLTQAMLSSVSSGETSAEAPASMPTGGAVPGGH